MVIRIRTDAGHETGSGLFCDVTEPNSSPRPVPYLQLDFRDAPARATLPGRKEDKA